MVSVYSGSLSSSLKLYTPVNLQVDGCGLRDYLTPLVPTYIYNKVYACVLMQLVGDLSSLISPITVFNWMLFQTLLTSTV